MSQPPPFVLPPDGPATRARALLAGAGRQRVAVAVLALVARLAAGVVWARATPDPAGPATGEDAARSPAQTLPRVAAAGSGAGDPGASAAAGAGGPSVGGADGPAGAGTAGSGAVGADGRVAVHVAGRVRRPGLVRLPAGSRVEDAIRAAGGSTAGADLDAVNLARRLTDGEQVFVPGPGDLPPPASGAGSDPGAAPAAPLDLNTATLEQLDTLPGVGEVTAGRIIAYRSAHPFTAVDELLEVPGIGQRRFEQLRDLVTVA
jgi:competence protein ComEA